MSKTRETLQDKGDATRQERHWETNGDNKEEKAKGSFIENYGSYMQERGT